MKSETATTGYASPAANVLELADHMNGRIYDPLLGRFLSADLLVQFPGSMQSFNRYSYVNNNPLSYTDPSGFEMSHLSDEEKKRIAEAHMKRAEEAAGASSIARDSIVGNGSGGNTGTIAGQQVSKAAENTDSPKPAQEQVEGNSPTKGSAGESKGEVSTKPNLDVSRYVKNWDEISNYSTTIDILGAPLYEVTVTVDSEAQVYDGGSSPTGASSGDVIKTATTLNAAGFTDLGVTAETIRYDNGRAVVEIKLAVTIYVRSDQLSSTENFDRVIRHEFLHVDDVFKGVDRISNNRGLSLFFSMQEKPGNPSRGAEQYEWSWYWDTVRSRDREPKDLDTWRVRLKEEEKRK